MHPSIQLIVKLPNKRPGSFPNPAGSPGARPGAVENSFDFNGGNRVTTPPIRHGHSTARSRYLPPDPMLNRDKPPFLTIVILDPHPVARMGLAVLIRQRSENTTVIEARDVAEFQRDNLRVKPGLFISVPEDPSAAGSAGLATDVKGRFPLCHLIIYGEERLPERAVAGLKSGVDGFFPRGGDLVELSECIGRVMTGETYLSPVYMRVLFAYLLAHHTVRRLRDVLTSRQLEIAEHLARGHSTTEIALMAGLHISTVSRFKATIFYKLGIDNILNLKEILER